MKSTNNSIDCDVVLEHIDAFIDGDLPSEEAVLVEAHVVICRSCAEELSFARELQHELHSFTKLDCPDRVIEAVYRHIEQEQPASVAAPTRLRPSFWQSVLAWLSSRSSPAFTPALTLGVVALIVAGIWFFAGTGTPETHSEAEVAEAKRQIEWTFAYLGSVNTKVTAAATGEVLQSCVVDPVQRAVEMAIQTNAPLEQ
jgi:anti-sigma factor RsiW